MEIRELAELTNAVIERVVPKFEDRESAQFAATSIRGADYAGEWQIALEHLVEVLLIELVPVTAEDHRDLKKLFDEFAKSGSAELRERAEIMLSQLENVVVI